MLHESVGQAAIEAICQGSPREMGFAQGKAARQKIHAACQALADMEAFRLQQPRWLPYRVYRWLAEQKAARFLAAPLAHDYPLLKERLAGIAAGADVSIPRIMLFNALEPILSSVGGCTASPGACSAVAIRGGRSATGEPIIVRNFDYFPLVQPFYMLRDCRPSGGLRAIEFTVAPLAGTVDGMNEAGLCITYNYGFTTDQPRIPAAPISMAISAALERCRTVSEAAELISSSKRWGGALLMLGDPSGDIASLELSSSRSHLRRPAAGEDMLQHTNAFNNPVMREVQIPDDAIYTERAPAALRGRRLHLSSEQRNRRFQQLLSGNAKFDCDQLSVLMADHGLLGVPDDYTPCVHGSYWQTTACLQFLPKQRRIRVSYSTACQARYSELGFS
jgi:hypothetical protein